MAAGHRPDVEASSIDTNGREALHPATDTVVVPDVAGSQALPIWSKQNAQNPSALHVPLTASSEPVPSGQGGNGSEAEDDGQTSMITSEPSKKKKNKRKPASKRGMVRTYALKLYIVRLLTIARENQQDSKNIIPKDHSLQKNGNKTKIVTIPAYHSLPAS